MLTGLITIEGGNASGKTTLAEAISARNRRSKIFHCGYGDTVANRIWDYHLETIEEAIKWKNDNFGSLVIIDRCWMSEEVYAHAYRNGTKWPHEGRIMQKLLLAAEALNIVCLLRPEEAIAQVDKHRKDYHTPALLTKQAAVAARYWDAWHGRNNVSNRVTYLDDVIASGGFKKRANLDYVSYSLYDQGRDLDKYIAALNDRLTHLSLSNHGTLGSTPPHNLGGHLLPARYLMVGDSVNYPDYTKCWPFVGYKHSTLFMTEVMHDLNCKEEEFMWTNADCSECHICQLVSDKPELRVIALGNKASQILDSLKVAHLSVPHPSYGMRFMGHAKWKAVLESALRVA